MTISPKPIQPLSAAKPIHPNFVLQAHNVSTYSHNIQCDTEEGRTKDWDDEMNQDYSPDEGDWNQDYHYEEAGEFYWNDE